MYMESKDADGRIVFNLGHSIEIHCFVPKYRMACKVEQQHSSCVTSIKVTIGEESDPDQRQPNIAAS